MAVIAILAGGFDDLLVRALWTIILVAIHALAGLGFINVNSSQNKKEVLPWVMNSVFAVIILSFITAVLGTWKVLPGDMVWKLYEVYGVAVFAILHAEVLSQILGRQALTNRLVYANYAFMAAVVVMFLVVIFAEWSSLGDMFFRIFGALAVVDGTLTLTSIILDRLYIDKHPELLPAASGPESIHKKHMNPFVIVLLVLIGFQFLGAIMTMVVNMSTLGR